MKTIQSPARAWRAVAVIGALLTLTLHALTCFAATLVTSSVDGGGGRSGAGSYTNDGCIGGIAGISAVVTPQEIVKAGYLGQLAEVSHLSVTGTPASVNEGGASQLSGIATMDDDSVTVLTGEDINWAAPSWPIQVITAAGVATAATVYANTPGAINGSYLGAPGAGSVLVLDSLPDNYSSYGDDGLPDNWQVLYFGLPPNADAAPDADVTGTGQNNLFKYTAGLDPTNPASVFMMQLADVPGQEDRMNLSWLPLAEGRTYTPLFVTNLMGEASWSPLVNIGGPVTNEDEISVIDLEAGGMKFYKIQITYP